MTASNDQSRMERLDRRVSLNMTPVRNVSVSEERSADGMALITYPVSMRPWMASVLKRLGHAGPEQRFKKLQLDMLGTEVWGEIDGKRSVRQIRDRFADRHRVARREAEIAVTQFLRDLGRRGIIGMR